jgi:hypothetical protein
MREFVDRKWHLYQIVLIGDTSHKVSSGNIAVLVGYDYQQHTHGGDREFMSELNTSIRINKQKHKFGDVSSSGLGEQDSYDIMRDE